MVTRKIRNIKYLLGGIFMYLRRCNINWRNQYYKNKYPLIDESVRIGYETIIDGGVIIIGKNTYFQRNCQIVGDVLIGKYCSIASGVNIWANTHVHTKINKCDVVIKGKIIIGDNVWIGTNAFIRENVTIGNNCIIGANSVVTHNVPDNKIVGGVPSKIIGVIDDGN